jgi:hypothetical protein
MGQEYTGAEHLLLGVIQEETCVVSRYLAKCNVTPSVLREVIQRVSTAVNNKDSVWRDVMASFLESEKTRQIAFKASKEWLSQGARKSGMYKGQKRPFCLDLNHAEENLFEMIRTRALTHFEINKIKWHDGHNGKPSNHLCDSQVCCVNFLFPFANKPELLASLLRPMFPTLKSILPLGSGQYVTFEWIGKDNYLGERVRGKGQRTRGANFTSADAAVFFERSDNKRQIVLIEWKYTESYNGTPFQVAPSGTDRRDIYRHVFDAEDCPLKKDLLPSYDSLFFEPFYQFMRQQFLAHKMEAAHELGAEVVSVLHIAPEHNKEFRRVTSPGLRFLDSSATGVWKKLVREPDRFTSVHTEQLFADVLNSPLPELKAWQDYVGQRYCWICEL